MVVVFGITLIGPKFGMGMTKYPVVRIGALYAKRPTLYGFNKINDNEGPLADRYEFVGTWEEVEAYALKHN